MKIDHEFLSIGYIQKKSAVYTQNTGILSDFSLIMGIADPFLLYIPKTQENQGVVGILLQFLCHMPNLRYFNIL